ncbi:hypothetical protein ACNPQM_42900 [Streptomyces sp. NPDC056231]|uniref:hypothetical protein n=1 Tax=Streptomyces sp. NPDC056231 TaxID=3345755 RepID=UPI003AAD42FD
MDGEGRLICEIVLDPGLYWCVSLNGMQLSGGSAMSYVVQPTELYEIRMWRVPGQFSSHEEVLGDARPLQYAAGALLVSHGEFWLTCGEAEEELVPPYGDTVVAAAGVAGVPTLVQDTRVGLALSLWEGAIPTGAGTPLGAFHLSATTQLLRCSSVDGPADAVLRLPTPGCFEGRVWRRIEPGVDFRCERYDVRIAARRRG